MSDRRTLFYVVLVVLALPVCVALDALGWMPKPPPRQKPMRIERAIAYWLERE